MITNIWGKILLAENFLSASTVSGGVDSLITLKTRRFTGEECTTRVSGHYQILRLLYNTTFPSSYNALKTTGNSNECAVGAIFGNGVNPVATGEDYCLSGDRITTLTGTRTTYGVTVDGNKYTLKALFTLTNTADTEITITEMGLLGSMSNVADGESRYYYASTLFDHTVLDNPVTIPAGGVGQVEYTITFNYPTA